MTIAVTVECNRHRKNKREKLITLVFLIEFVFLGVGFSRFPRELFRTEYVAESSPELLPRVGVPLKVSASVVVVSGHDGKRDGSDLSWCIVFKTPRPLVVSTSEIFRCPTITSIVLRSVNPDRFSTGNTVKRRTGRK